MTDLEAVYQVLLQVVVAALAAIGIEEWAKNFFKPTNTKWLALLMIPLSVGCYLSIYYLPPVVIGCILAIGFTQNFYQSILQATKDIVEGIIHRLTEGAKK